MTVLPELTLEQRSFLQALLSQQRIENLENILNARLGDIAVVLDNLFDPHNMGAIVRTVEALGIQDIHVIEKDTALDLSAKVTKYSDKWISIHTHKNVRACTNYLRKEGFQIVVAQMTETAVPVHDFEVFADSKIAVVMGNEHAGASEEICRLADSQVIIPMYGFTESFNVSVATALVLGDFVKKKRSAILPETGTLDDNRKESLYDQWLQKAVKKSEILLKAFKYKTD
ncbi:MAG: RNA methyltransferase [Acidobacteria bacterium]|nr:RNA methyltransferase [Acidobacteriota bacterium]